MFKTVRSITTGNGNMEYLFAILLLFTNANIEGEAEAATLAAYASLVPREQAPEVEKPVPKTKLVSYKEAHRQYTEEDQPFIVFITATWCGPCGTQKDIIDRTALKTNLVVVDYDNNPDLVSKLTNNRRITLPHFILFEKNKRPRTSGSFTAVHGGRE